MSTSLKGQFLIAMPTLDDPNFDRSVIFVCEHNEEGAMGFVINKESSDVSLSSMFDQLKIETVENFDKTNPPELVRAGGPCRPSNGFVVFPTDETRFKPETHGIEFIDDICSFSNDIEFLRQIADGNGPDKFIVVLGFAGWAPGQLEQELIDNAWLHVEADEELLFSGKTDQVWDKAIAKLGIDPARLSLFSGSA